MVHKFVTKIVCLRNIENEIADLNKKLNFDVGPNAEFASMIDKCFEYEDREYVYKLCPFEKSLWVGRNVFYLVGRSQDVNRSGLEHLFRKSRHVEDETDAADDERKKNLAKFFLKQFLIKMIIFPTVKLEV